MLKGNRLNIEIGIDSFAALQPDLVTRVAAPAADRMKNLVEEIVVADEAGIDVFGLGEHHRAEFLDSAPVVILAAAASLTKRIKLASAVTVLSAADPVRVFQEFATLDLLTRGRVEITVGRGSFTESFPLFGRSLEDYDSLFTENLDLLLKLRESTTISWQGKHRPALIRQGVYPRPFQERIPIWVGVGGTPESFQRAGTLGLPLMVAIIGGTPERFRSLVDLYRQSGARAGISPEKLKVGVHAFGYCAETDQQAADEFFPGYADGTNKIGLERGWPTMTRRNFDALLSSSGALAVGSPETVADKIRHFNEALGGIDRFDFQMSPAALHHQRLLASTRLIGSRVIPLVKGRA
jgi:probable LLM family oxidoreductase